MGTSNHCPTSANFVYCVGFTMKIVIALVLVACVYVQASPVRDGDDEADGSSVSNVCTINKVDGKLVMSKGCAGAGDDDFEDHSEHPDGADGSRCSNVCNYKLKHGKLVKHCKKHCAGAGDDDFEDHSEHPDGADGSRCSNVCNYKLKHGKLVKHCKKHC